MRAEQPQYARGRGLADAAHPGPLDGVDEGVDAAARLLAAQRQDVLRQRLGQRAAGTRVLARCGLERLEAAAFVCVVPGLERAPARADAPSLRGLVRAGRRGLAAPLAAGGPGAAAAVGIGYSELPASHRRVAVETTKRGRER